MEIKLLGIARGSNQELLEDYMDYLKQYGLTEWAEGNKPRYDRLRAFCKEHSDDRISIRSIRNGQTKICATRLSACATW